MGIAQVLELLAIILFMLKIETEIVMQKHYSLKL